MKTKFYNTLISFLEYPLQEDYEITVIDHIETELTNYILYPENYNDISVKQFLKSVYNALSFQGISDKFYNELEKLFI